MFLGLKVVLTLIYKGFRGPVQSFKAPFGGYPFWTAIAQPPEVQFTQVHFLQPEDSRLMILKSIPSLTYKGSK